MAEKTADSSLKTSRVDLDNKSSATNAVSSYANNLSQNNTTVKSDTSSTKYSMQENDNNTQELDNSSFNLKEKQNTSWQEHLEKNYKSI